MKNFNILLLKKIGSKSRPFSKKPYLCRNFERMKRLIPLIIVLIFNSLQLLAQDQPNPDGYNVFYYPNGKKSSEGAFVNGQPDGWWKSYNEKGTLVSEGNRRNGQLDSTWFFYGDNGDTTLIINYKEGKKNGKRIQFYADESVVEVWDADSLTSPVCVFDRAGHLRRTTPILEGKPHGMEKSFDTAGHIVQLAIYHRGILTRRETINRTDNFGYKQGKWKWFWPNGNLKLEGTFVNDKRDGYFKQYDEDGNFLLVEKYENDYLVADAKETKQLERKVSYHSNGQPSVIATFYNGKAEGVRREFDAEGNVVKGYVFENGVMLFEGITDMEGHRQGKWKEFYPTGELKSEGTYKNSNRIGAWKYYFPDKSIEVSGSYDSKGRQDGTWRWYYANGQLMREEFYENGVLDGEFVEYDERGNEITKGKYVEGAEEGYWFYQRNHAIEEGNYYDGMRTGLWKTWFEKGNISSEIEYDQDLMNGKYTIYYENHVVKRTGKCINGERDGVWYDYNDNGELILTTLYKDGVEVRWNNYKIDYE